MLVTVHFYQPFTPSGNTPVGYTAVAEGVPFVLRICFDDVSINSVLVVDFIESIPSDIVVRIDKVLIGENKRRYLIPVGQIECMPGKRVSLECVPGGKYGAGELTVSRMDYQFEVFLGRAGGKPRSGARTLGDMEYHGAFQHGGKAYSFRHEIEPTPGGGHHRPAPRVPRA